MVHASLFSGIGGPEIAAEMMGWINAFHCEINPFGRRVLEYWYPQSKSYEDITKTDFRPWRGKIDILTGGFPCQPFSYAGKRGGADDNRYLWPQMLRAIDEIRPAWVVGENVAGITTMVEGGICADLGGEATLCGEGDGVHRYALRETFTIERICRDLESHGYSLQPVLVPAAAVGAPHRRDRIFILAHNDRDSMRDGCNRGQEEIQGSERNFWNTCAGSSQRLREEARPDTADGCNSRAKGAHERRAEADQTGSASHTDSRGSDQGYKQVQPGITNRSELEQSRSRWTVADSYFERLSIALQPGGDDPQERNDAGRSALKYTHDAWLEGTWWDNFPTVSPIYRGNDGLPFDVDGLTVPPIPGPPTYGKGDPQKYPFGKWRTESLKAYGNAIVPQVMYRIFQAIEAAQQP